MKLEEINALYEKATPGAFVYTPTNLDEYHGFIEGELCTTVERFWPDGGDDNTVACGLRDDADGELLAALKNAWPSIYRELMAARAMRDAHKIRAARAMQNVYGLTPQQIQERCMAADPVPSAETAYDAARLETDK